jgi:hypothetical protein
MDLAKSERKAKTAQNPATNVPVQVQETVQTAGETPSKAKRATPNDRTVQDCLTGTTRTKPKVTNASSQIQHLDVETKSQPLLDLGEVSDNNNNIVTIEDKGSRSVSEQHDRRDDNDNPQELSKAPGSTSHKISTSNDQTKLAVTTCQDFLGSEFDLVIVKDQGNVTSKGDRDAVQVVSKECQKQEINTIERVPAIDNFLRELQQHGVDADQLLDSIKRQSLDGTDSDLARQRDDPFCLKPSQTALWSQVSEAKRVF